MMGKHHAKTHHWYIGNILNKMIMVALLACHILSFSACYS
jgi:hypothetical protein